MCMELSHNQPTRLHNKRCAYCNAEFARDNEPQKEHVIGRRFVPKGSHDRQWNLHLNSCNECNQRKSELENDISAITMISQFSGKSEDELLLSEVSRKSRTKSNRTGKPVSDSAETSINRQPTELSGLYDEDIRARFRCHQIFHPY